MPEELWHYEDALGVVREHPAFGDMLREMQNGDYGPEVRVVIEFLEAVIASQDEQLRAWRQYLQSEKGVNHDGTRVA
jgi:hypothetical protein